MAAAHLVERVVLKTRQALLGAELIQSSRAVAVAHTPTPSCEKADDRKTTGIRDLVASEPVFRHARLHACRRCPTFRCFDWPNAACGPDVNSGAIRCTEGQTVAPDFHRPNPVDRFNCPHSNALPEILNMTQRAKLILADAAVALVMAAFAIAMVLRFAVNFVVW